jgi:hypothetical protein
MELAMCIKVFEYDLNYTYCSIDNGTDFKPRKSCGFTNSIREYLLRLNHITTNLLNYGCKLVSNYVDGFYGYLPCELLDATYMDYMNPKPSPKMT